MSFPISAQSKDSKLIKVTANAVTHYFVLIIVRFPMQSHLFHSHIIIPHLIEVDIGATGKRCSGSLLVLKTKMAYERLTFC